MADQTENADIVEAPAPPKRAPKSFFLKNKLNRYFIDEEYYIEHLPMDEGVYEAFQDLTSTIKVDQEGGSTEVDMKLGATRRFLLEKLVVSWNLVDDDGTPVVFSHAKLRELPPHIIGKLVESIYTANTILTGGDEGKAA